MIFEKIIEIYQNNYLYLNCLGRMYSLLGTNTTNMERGSSLLLALTMENHQKYLSCEKNVEEEAVKILRILAENSNYIPAQKVLENEGLEYSKKKIDLSCFLCNNIFSEIPKYVRKAKELLEDIEFRNLLIGTTLNPQIINREDKFKAKFTLLEAESFKSHFNRVVGKQLTNILKVPTEFNNPDVLFNFSLEFESFQVNIRLKSLFIYGKYNKLIRGIPQTHWDCRLCRGKGCETCNFTGKQYLTSVEEHISPEFVKESISTGSKFHGAGREDIDVRMLGDGRPFILELKNPKIRTLDLITIKERVNESNKKKVKISSLRYSSKREVIELKKNTENTRKVYRALVESKKEFRLEDFEEKRKNLKNCLENRKIRQRTPIRVSHRRADKIREKLIYKIDGNYISPQLFEFTIETQGGTYIKELINGDDGRTPLSISHIFESALICKELDVIQIK